MREALVSEFNKTQTENGALAYKSTGSKLLDYFSKCGALRATSEDTVINLFVKAYAENPEYALKTLFYGRDIRGGLGERKVFRTILKYLAETHPESVKPLIGLIPEYGRYDDLFVLMGTQCENEMLEFVRTQLLKDIVSQTPSLLAKWMPSENTSSKATVLMAGKIRRYLGYKPSEYRKTLSALRKKIGIVEREMSAQKWTSISYERVPSKAGMLYRGAFKKHDSLRYSTYLDSVKKGVAKINTSALYPYEIFNAVLRGGNNDTLNVIWDKLPDYTQKNENAIVMADVSGSMSGLPMSVSVSLALYFAERNQGAFKNLFMTFSRNPELVEVMGKTLYEKMRNIQRSNWNMDTNLTKALMKILSVAVNGNVPQSELPTRLYIISDMQFNMATVTSRVDETVYQHAKAEYAKAGYEMPEVVFWNVDARENMQSPITQHESGVQLVSGCSPVVFKQVLSGLTATELMFSILNSPRYANIK